MKTLICQRCGKQFTRSNGRYNEAVKKGWNFFCSLKCRNTSYEKGEEFQCAECSEKVIKTPAQFRKTKFNVFCSKSCAANYNNKHKKYGTRRSKLERFLENQLKLNFPELRFFFNNRHTIGAELDFYFPDLKLAIELNGILHFQPIYGKEKLLRIQEIDTEKRKSCFKSGIELIIFDVSRENQLTQKIKDKNWKKVKELVTSKSEVCRLHHEQVSSL